MITYCPSCRTHFRVHAEQLAARAGQVRCGKCSRVFDALEHLIEEIAPARTLRPKPEFEAIRTDTADSEPAPELVASEALDIDANAQQYVVVKTADGVVEAQESGVGPAGAAISEPTIAEPTSAEPLAASGASTFGFGPRLAAEPATPARHWPWLPGALLLLLILLAQATYHFRSAITVLFPETKTYAVALCASLGCELTLPRRIALMSIEASDLQADTTNPNIMVLSATLKNRAVFDQQHPLLELTLTDAQDRPVVRRVLAPQDYLAKAVNSQTGFAANTEIAIKVSIEGSDVKATGYRLYLFYP